MVEYNINTGETIIVDDEIVEMEISEIEKTEIQILQEQIKQQQEVIDTLLIANLGV